MIIEYRTWQQREPPAGGTPRSPPAGQGWETGCALPAPGLPLLSPEPAGRAETPGRRAEEAAMTEAMEVGAVLLVLCLVLGRLAIGPRPGGRTDDDR